MTPPLKKLVIFGLATGLGKMVLGQINYLDLEPIERQLIIENSNEIILAGQKAIDKCFVKVDRNRLKNASKKIDQVCKNGGEFSILETLSFLLLGLQDLHHYCKDKETIKAVEDVALNFTTIYDPNLEDEETHVQALEKYERWIN